MKIYGLWLTVGDMGIEQSHGFEPKWASSLFVILFITLFSINMSWEELTYGWDTARNY